MACRVFLFFYIYLFFLMPLTDGGVFVLFGPTAEAVVIFRAVFITGQSQQCESQLIWEDTAVIFFSILIMGKRAGRRDAEMMAHKIGTACRDWMSGKTHCLPVALISACVLIINLKNTNKSLDRKCIVSSAGVWPILKNGDDQVYSVFTICSV